MFSQAKSVRAKLGKTFYYLKNDLQSLQFMILLFLILVSISANPS